MIQRIIPSRIVKVSINFSTVIPNELLISYARQKNVRNKIFPDSKTTWFQEYKFTLYNFKVNLMWQSRNNGIQSIFGLY